MLSIWVWVWVSYYGNRVYGYTGVSVWVYEWKFVRAKNVHVVLKCTRVLVSYCYRFDSNYLELKVFIRVTMFLFEGYDGNTCLTPARVCLARVLLFTYHCSYILTAWTILSALSYFKGKRYINICHYCRHANPGISREIKIINRNTYITWFNARILIGSNRCGLFMATKAIGTYGRHLYNEKGTSTNTKESFLQY